MSARLDACPSHLCSQGRRLGDGLRARSGGRLRFERLGEAEVEDLDPAIGVDHDVGGFEVTVDDPALVGGCQRLGDLQRDLQGLIQGDRAVGDSLVEALTVHQLHDEHVPAVDLFETEKGGDVGVVERGEDLGFALETGVAFIVSDEGPGQDLDGHLAVETGVVRSPHLAHPALSELGENGVLPESFTG